MELHPLFLLSLWAFLVCRWRWRKQTRVSGIDGETLYYSRQMLLSLGLWLKDGWADRLVKREIRAKVKEYDELIAEYNKRMVAGGGFSVETLHRLKQRLLH